MQGSRERTLAELAIADIDEAWLLDAAVAMSSEPTTAVEAAALLRVAHRAECAYAARRMAMCQAIEELPFPSDMPARARDFADLEIAVAMNVSPGTAGARRHQAEQAMRLLPETHRRLSNGQASEYHLIRLLQLAIDEKTEELLSRAEALAWQQAGDDATAPELAKAARRIMARLDHMAFGRKSTQSSQHADVRLRVTDGGTMGVVSGYLPILDAVSVMNAVQARAESLRSAGDERGVGRLRADALRQISEESLVKPDGTTRSNHGRPLELQVSASLESVVGLSDNPGEIVGFGPLSAYIVRDLIKDARIRLIVTGDGGRILDFGRKTYRAPASLAAASLAAYPVSIGPGSTTPARFSDLDHHEPFDGTNTVAGNLYPLDRRTHRAKTLGGWSYTVDPTTGEIIWHTALGQTATTRPFDYRLGP